MFKCSTAATVVLVIALTTIVPTALAGEEPPETPATFIELVGPVAERDAEVSGLTWYGDYLFLMVENPNIYATEGNAGMFYALKKTDVLAYLLADAYGQAPAPLEPMAIPIIAPDIMETVPGFDGFEASVFVADQVFLMIEADTEDETMLGIMVAGTIEPDLSAITLDLENLLEISPQTEFNNMSYESLFVAGDKLVTLYEANGAGVNPEPMAYVVDFDFETVETIPFVNVEYRITDVTALDKDGVFWATNYFFVGEDFMATDSDPVFEAYGMGASQAEFDGFERLIALQYAEEGVSIVETAPIQLEMTEESNGRNWEGIARLGDVGFLIATDKYPETLLGFVPTP